MSYSCLNLTEDPSCFKLKLPDFNQPFYENQTLKIIDNILNTFQKFNKILRDNRIWQYLLFVLTVPFLKIEILILYL